MISIEARETLAVVVILPYQFHFLCEPWTQRFHRALDGILGEIGDDEDPLHGAAILEVGRTIEKPAGASRVGDFFHAGRLPMLFRTAAMRNLS